MRTTVSAVQIRQFKKPSEGCLGYGVADAAQRQAVIIDPRHDQVEEYLAWLRREGLKLSYVIDTHTHADHLSGAAALKKVTGANYAMLAGTLVQAADTALVDGQCLCVGDIEFKVIASPGHTPDSLSLLVGDNLFTGDTMLIGGSGRTDFMGGDGGALYDSFQKFAELSDEITIWPGHDYQGRTHSTLGAERKHNVIFTARSRDAVVKKLSTRGPLPANMAEILTFNRKGEAPGVHVDAMAVQDMQRRGATLLDVRSPLEFAGEWIEDSWNIPNAELESRLGELAAAGKPVVLVCAMGNRALMAAQVLERRGFKEYRILERGLAGWRKAGLPLKHGRKRLSIERQVHIGAGSLVLTGVLLGTFVSPWFYALSAFVGAGLTFAGLSGFCGMALVFMKMPWNKFSPSSAGGTSGSCSAGGGATGGGCSAGGCSAA